MCPGFRELVWPLAQLDSGLRGGHCCLELDRKGSSVGPVSPEASVGFTTLSQTGLKLFKVEPLTSKLFIKRLKTKDQKNLKLKLLRQNKAVVGAVSSLHGLLQ